MFGSCSSGKTESIQSCILTTRVSIEGARVANLNFTLLELDSVVRLMARRVRLVLWHAFMYEYSVVLPGFAYADHHLLDKGDLHFSS